MIRIPVVNPRSQPVKMPIPSRRTPILILLFHLLAVAGPATALDLDLPEKFVMPNGLTVIIKESHMIPLVSVAFMVHGGTLQERPEESGMSAMAARVWRDLEEDPVTREAAHQVQAVGGWFRSSADTLSLSGLVAVPSDRIADAIRLVKGWSRRHEIPENVLEEAREKLLREHEIRKEYPISTGVLKDHLWAAAYGEHALARPDDGDPGVIRTLTPEALAGFLQRVVSPERAVLVVVGDIEVDPVLELVQEHLSSSPASPYRLDGVAPPASPGRDHQETHESGAIEKAHGMIGFRIPSIEHEDYAAAVLIGEILGSGPGSVLHRRLVERERHLEKVQMEVTEVPFENLLSFRLDSTSTEVRTAARIAVEECRRIGRWGVSSEDLEAARRGAKARQAFDRQMMISQAIYLGRAELAGDLDLELDFAHRLDQVSGSDLQRVAREWFQPRSAVFSELVPSGSTKDDEGGVMVENLGPGITGVFQRDSGTDVVGITVFLGRRFGDEPDGRTGIAGLTESLLVQGGSSRRSKGQIETLLARTGSEFSAQGKGIIGIVLTAQATVHTVEEVLPLLRDVALAPRFDTDALERAQSHVLDSWKEVRQNAGNNGYYRVRQLLFGAPVAPEIDAIISGIEASTLEDVRAFHHGLLEDAPLVIALTGDLTRRQALHLMQHAFADDPALSDRGAPAAAKVGGGVGKVGEDESIPRALTPPETSIEGVPAGAPARIHLERIDSDRPYDTVWFGIRFSREACSRFGEISVWNHILLRGHDSQISSMARKLDPGFEWIFRGLNFTEAGAQINAGIRLRSGLGETLGRSIRAWFEQPTLDVTKEAIDVTRRHISTVFLQVFQNKGLQSMNLATATGVLDAPDFFTSALESYSAVTVESLRTLARTHFNHVEVVVYEGEVGGE